MYQGMHIDSAPYLTILFSVKVKGIGMDFKENTFTQQIMILLFPFKLTYIELKSCYRLINHINNENLTRFRSGGCSYKLRNGIVLIPCIKTIEKISKLSKIWIPNTLYGVIMVGPGTKPPLENFLDVS